MAKNRIIFYSIFGVYQLLTFVFAASIDPENISQLLKLQHYLPALKYITFLGLALIATDFVWAWIQARKNKKECDGFRHENNTLKAKIYDIQESKKEPASVK